MTHNARIPEADFVRLYKELGPHALARRLDIAPDNVFQRRRRLERKLGHQITGPADNTRHNVQHAARLQCEVLDGTVLIASDCHYWPGPASTAHRAFVQFCRTLKPKVVIKNGDVFDGARVSRHPPITWEKRPTVIEEIEACQERLNEIQKAAKDAELYWPLGNHDARFETRLATCAPEYARVKGVHLKDHFSERWQPCMSVWINGDIVVKHRYKGGIHATHNNTLWSGKTMVTGHLHSLKVTPFTDYTGTRWGIDTGTMADPYGPQFVYTEDNPLNWRSGFIVLTFAGGRLLTPEMCRVIGPDEVDFRGKILKV